MLWPLLELVIPPTTGSVVAVTHLSRIGETSGSSPGLALSFLLPQPPLRVRFLHGTQYFNRL